MSSGNNGIGFEVLVEFDLERFYVVDDFLEGGH